MLLIDRVELLLLTLVLTVVAIACKFGGTLLASRVTGLGWRESAVIGTLMNTRGLTELIVLNLALEKGVISEALFAMLVIMALVTTFMAGPLLKLLDPKNQYGAPIEEELADARKESQDLSTLPIPERAILVAPQTEGALPQLLALTEPLARSTPPRELILARLIPPPRGASVRGGLQTEGFMLRAASAEVQAARARLLAERVAARAVAFTSTEVGRDLVQLAEDEAVDLLLLDGRRPLLGGGVPKGDVGTVLDKAPCDVAVLVAREAVAVAPGSNAPILVPFGGREHDWAALELGRVAVLGDRRAAEAARRGRPDRRRARREPAARERLDARPALRRRRLRARDRRARQGRDPRCRGRRRPARRRPVGPLAPGGPRPDARRARELRSRADPVRPPRRARRRARPARGRHALHLVVAEHRERRPGAPPTPAS